METKIEWHRWYTGGSEYPFNEPRESGEYLVSNGRSVIIAEFYSGGEKAVGGWDIGDDRIGPNYDVVWWAEKPNPPCDN